MCVALLRLVVVGILLGLQPCAADCPRLCECKWKSGKESVLCLNANLSVVPTHLDAGTQILDLTANQLQSIRHDEFSQAGLLNLQKVYVSKCRLRSIDRYAFRHLINLVELDLSYNALPAVPSHALDSIPELRELRLSGNPITRIAHDAFVHVPQLVRLELSDCRIATIDTRAFRGLERSLEWLKLDRNRVVEVGAAALTMLENLHGLELAGNPWNCSCVLRPLREWMVRRNVPYGIPPVCQHPQRLAAKSWDRLDLDEFACVPEIFAYDARTHGVEGRNVTMACGIHGVPEPNVRWMLKNKVIANLSSVAYSNANSVGNAAGRKLYVVHLQNSSSDLTILAADVQDAGVYVCAAENKAGKVEASVTLAMSRRPPDGPLSSHPLLAGVVAAVLFVLSTCVVVLCAYAMRRKSAYHRRSEDDYEKIEMSRKTGDTTINGRVPSATGELGTPLGSRRNGDYRVVPAADNEEDEEAIGEVEAKSGRCLNETPFWHPPLHDTHIGTQWKDSDPDPDLHIPRRPKSRLADQKSELSAHSVYQMPSTSQRPTAPTFSSDLSSLLETDEKKFPDLIENSPNASSTHTTANNNNNNNFATSKANSEGGGSVADISELFCTLPRKRVSRYLSADSQSPLLPAADSRYGSSGGESSSSSSRRLSEPHRHPKRPLGAAGTSAARSSSYLNLQSPIRETPLLDVASLDDRIAITRDPQPNNPPPPTTNLNTYDYHAAQLERFLEEYRTLQKELTRMKETCDNMRQDKYIDPMHNSLPVTPAPPISPNSNHPTTHFDSDLTRYLLKSSPKTINTSGLFHN